jgi:hypothetical protein
LVDPSPVAPDSSEPTGPEAAVDPDGQLFAKLKAWTLAARDHLADWRQEAEEAFEFYNGRQWTDEERRIFESDGRVAPIFNLTAINVDAVCGLEVNNRQDVKYLPRTEGDVQINELLSDAAMWIRDQAQSEDEESDAFRDAVVTGLGVTETRRSNDPDITVDRRDPTECFYDPTAKKPNIIDRRFGGRIVMLDVDEALDMFPGQTVQTLHAKWAQLGLKDDKPGTEQIDYPLSQPSAPIGDKDWKPKKICLVEIEWVEFKQGQRIKQQAFLGATTVLEVNPLEAWAYNFMTGKRDRKKNTWYGIVRALRDPQKLINKFLATVTHIMATNAKGGLIYERGAFVDQRQAEKDWSNPQKNVEVVEGALSGERVQPRVAPPLPAGAIQLIEFAIGNIRNISGINVELLGAADRDQPASLELQRRQSAVTILASLFDAKRRYHKEQGQTLLALMRTLPPETLVRVTIDQPPPMPPQPGMPPEQVAQAQQQQQQAQKQQVFAKLGLVAQALSDPAAKFDVIVDEAPSSPNQQQQITATIAQLVSHGMQLPPQAQAILVKSVGLPDTVADELAQALGQGQQDPQVGQLSQALQQEQQKGEALRQELAGVKMDRSIEQDKVNVDRMRAATEQTKVNADAVAKTGGVPQPGGQITPLADILLKLQQDVQDIGTVIAHSGMIQRPAPPMQGAPAH